MIDECPVNHKGSYSDRNPHCGKISMRNTSKNSNELLARRADACDAQVERAKVRKARAMKLGNQREVDGAIKTIKDCKENAKWLRAKITK